VLPIRHNGEEPSPPKSEEQSAMSEATETTHKEAKGHSVIAQAAGVGMAMLGSSTAGDAFAGSSVPHADHGHSAARWAGSIISMVGFLVGGVLFPFAMVPAVIVGGALQVAALVTAVALNAAGFGRPDVWGELRAKAAAERTTV
jgi:hypothetical protein